MQKLQIVKIMIVTICMGNNFFQAVNPNSEDMHMHQCQLLMKGLHIFHYACAYIQYKDIRIAIIEQCIANARVFTYARKYVCMYE